MSDLFQVSKGGPGDPVSNERNLTQVASHKVCDLASKLGKHVEQG